jgi:hypothetical protein
MRQCTSVANVVHLLAANVVAMAHRAVMVLHVAKALHVASPNVVKVAVKADASAVKVVVARVQKALLHHVVVTHKR